VCVCVCVSPVVGGDRWGMNCAHPCTYVPDQVTGGEECPRLGRRGQGPNQPYHHHHHHHRGVAQVPAARTSSQYSSGGPARKRAPGSAGHRLPRFTGRARACPYCCPRVCHHPHPGTRPHYLGEGLPGEAALVFTSLLFLGSALPPLRGPLLWGLSN